MEAFGHFHQQRFVFQSAQFNTIYGANEAGKTTLMTFIIHMLFGFPHRTTLSPYIREQSGGRLTVDIEGETVIIERYAGINKGRATLFRENGSIESEDVLAIWLQGMNQTLYQHIYAFDIDGIAHLEKLSSEDLNHYLFSTGMMGNERISQIERVLDKHMGERFKPGGRNPMMNQELKSLDDKRGQLKDWEKQRQTYDEKINEWENVREREQELRERRAALQEEALQYQRYQSVLPLLVEQQDIKQALDQQPKQTFPDQGLEQLESLRSNIMTLEGEQAEKQDKINRIKERIDMIRTYPDILREEAAIKQLMSEQPTIEQARRNRDEVSHQLAHENQALQATMEHLGPEWTKETIRNAEIHIEAKDQLQKVLQHKHTLEQKKELVEQQLDNSTSQLERLQDRLTSLKSRLLTEEKRKQLEQATQSNSDAHAERDWLEHQLNTARGSSQLQKAITRTQKSLTVTLSLLAIAGGWLGWQQLDRVFGLLAFAVIAAGALAGYMALGRLKKTWTTSQEQIDDWQRRLNEVASSSPSTTDRELLENDRRLRVEYDHLQQQFTDEQDHNQRILEQLDTHQQQLNDALHAIYHWLQDHGFPQTTTIDLLPDIYDWVAEGRRQLMQIEVYQNKKVSLEEQLQQFKQGVETVGQRISMDNAHAAGLEQWLETAKAAERDVSHQQAILEQYEEDVAGLQKKIGYYQDQIRQLLAQAGVESEEAFHEKGRHIERQQQQQTRLQALKQQMTVTAGSEALLVKIEQWFAKGTWSERTQAMIEQDIRDIDQNLQELQDQRTALQSDIKYLEDNEAYPELVHDYEQLKASFNHRAKEWAVYQTALQLLKTTKRTYQTERLPYLLKQTSAYFKMVTHGRYENVQYDDNHGFYVMASTGEQRFVSELSRGTKEQLYVCLRLALGQMFETQTAMPMIIDDSLVNFDRQRRQETLDLLKQFSKQHQMIILTCHESQIEDSGEFVELSL